jgi:hypothetical protein
MIFLFAGMIPPMSLFLHTVLSEYGLLLANLHPNSILVLAIFQYLCEAFISVKPSIALFYHFYYLRVEPWMLSGSVTFCLRDRLSKHYILVDKKKHEEWKHRWCFVRFPESDDSLAEPSSPVNRKASWSNLGERDEEFAPALAHIWELRELGLSSK